MRARRCRMKSVPCSVLYPASVKVQRGQQHIRRIEPRIDLFGMPEALEKQAGADQHDQRQGDLRNDQYSS